MRIEPMLPKLMHPDQTGFVKGRYIGENAVRLIFDIMEQTRVNNIPGILISVDFKKAFDSLEWSCIQSTLQKFNFGDSIRKWIEVFYTDIESAALEREKTVVLEHRNFDKDFLAYKAKLGFQI